MNVRKSNIGTWYRLALATLAVVLCVILAAGTAFARYRTESEAEIAIQAQAVSYVYLGGVFNGEFTAGSGNWQNNDEGNPQLQFMLSNQGVAEAAAPGDQEVWLRVLVSETLGNQGLQLVLTTPDRKNIMATPTPIGKTTPLYQQFGPGWIYTFQDTNGEELTWELDGGVRSEVTMTLTALCDIVPDTSLIQLQATGRPAND